jgi:hypothetical protein
MGPDEKDVARKSLLVWAEKATISEQLILHIRGYAALTGAQRATIVEQLILSEVHEHTSNRDKLVGMSSSWLVGGFYSYRRRCQCSTQAAFSKRAPSAKYLLRLGSAAQ